MRVSTEGMRSYQLELTKMLVDGRRLLIQKYGTGKTWVILAAISKLSEKCRSWNKTTLVVFCRNRNQMTWTVELLKRDPSLRVVRFSELVDITENDPVDVLLVPHHTMSNDAHQETVASFVKKRKPFAMVCDESTRIKNSNTLMSTAILTLADLHQTLVSYGVRMCMTGWATPEGAHNIWSQVRFCSGRPCPLGATYYSFLSQYFLTTDRGPALRFDKRETFYDNAQILIAKMTPYMWEQYRKSYTGPQSVYKTEYYEETAEQRRLLDELETKWSLTVVDETVEFAYTMQTHAKAHQIANGFVMDENQNVECIDSDKQDLLIEVIERVIGESQNPKKQILIFAHFRQDYIMLQKLLEGYDWTFGIGPEDAVVQAFEKGEIQIIIMPITLSDGYNALAVADTAIFYSNVFSIETRIQAEFRLNRANQKSPVITFIDLCGHRSYDRQVIEALQLKRPLKGTP